MIENNGPDVLTVENVQFWCKHSKELKQSQSHKARLFVEYGCLHYVGDDPEFNSKYTFLCLPLNTKDLWTEGSRSFKKVPFDADYNNSAYKIYKNDQGVFECNCQGWQTKSRNGEMHEDGVNCSHVLALFFAFKLKIFGTKQGARETDLQPDKEHLKKPEEEL